MAAKESHVGRELELMLVGNKPLAMFYDNPDLERDERIVPEIQFGEHVKIGRFVKAELTFEAAVDPRTHKPIRVRYVLYALTSEQWRINAMQLVLEATFKMGRADEGLDRIRGALLGHNSDEIDDFISKHRNQYGLFALKYYDESSDAKRHMGD